MFYNIITVTMRAKLGFRNEVRMREELLKQFADLFQDSTDNRVYFAPGRVNLIGEHTDYNGGHVFPCALTIGTYAVVRRRTDKKLRFYSVNFQQKGIIESSLEQLTYVQEDDWANYPKGMIWAMMKKGYRIDCGFDMLIYGNIPNASGLSSSASLEVVTGTAANDLYSLQIDPVNIALLGQFAENKFIGVNCGIMDQFAVAMGKKDHAVFLDTSTLDYEYAPLQLKEARIVIACSNKKRGLSDSKYNERRSQCEEALKDLQKHSSITSLGELTNEQFEQNRHIIQDDVCARRAKHAVEENQRTIEAVAALKNDDITKFGELMNQSHISLRDDYEVTGIELDTLAEAAWEQPGVIGSRMTGAGFGGCTVSIVKNDAIDMFIRNVGDNYLKKIGYAADFYVVQVGQGAGRLEEE